MKDIILKIFYYSLILIPISGLMLACFCIFAAIGNKRATTETCEEYCQPQQVLNCDTQSIKFWHPKYVDVVITCGPPPENRVIKQK